MTIKELSKILNQIEYDRKCGKKGLTVEELKVELDNIIDNLTI